MLMKPNSRILSAVGAAGLVLAALVLIPSSVSLAQDPDPQTGSRQIHDKVFTNTRPVPVTSPGSGTSAPGAKNYRRVKRTQIAKAGIKPPTTAKPPTTGSTPTATTTVAPKWEDIPETADKLGVTIWRVRAPQTGEGGARLLVQRASMVPERVASDTVLNVGDQVFLSVESPREGFLYILDREMYADGKMSDPYLIFPTKTTRDGDNRVRSGKLINIPDQYDQTNTFTLAPQPPRNDQIGENLTIIITTQPLEKFEPTRHIAEYTPAPEMTKLTSAHIAAWETRWGGRNEQFELDGGAGVVMTQGEQDAARTGEGARLLMQPSPPPQTFYLVDSGYRDGLLVNVELRYRR
jgi:hypothetical protein